MERQVVRERWRLLHQIVRLLELPMTVLGLLWVVLLAIDLVAGLHGYVTATLATFFIDRDADRPDAAVAGEPSIDALHERLDALQRLLEARLPPAT